VMPLPPLAKPLPKPLLRLRPSKPIVSTTGY
jgi:hypothetical protein